ncbi:hypothetical protein [Streptomyces profundus]|uniref:hypothetical protein n=1 Tax=Streptomyces profundus TaxID=2867410 RepID=UPI001D16DF72|nr:hypothetical protein [Streptomyces sp. MA3_2.13]UED85159.1 hypothetical protein K4G22_13925 [Streptomyces sp. MA3_2.13]
MNSLKLPRLSRISVVPALAAVLLVGCSSGDDEPEGVESSESPVAEDPAAGDEPEAADDIEVLEQLYLGYQARLVEMESTGNADGALLEEYAELHVREGQSARIRQLAQEGITRQGEPEVYDVTVEVTDDSAVIQACVDTEHWEPLLDGEPIDREYTGPSAGIVKAARGESGWLISDHPQTADEATITCT